MGEVDIFGMNQYPYSLKFFSQCVWNVTLTQTTNETN